MLMSLVQFLNVIFEWVGVPTQPEAGKGWCKLTFGLNNNSSKTPAWCHQGIIHGPCAQTMLRALVTTISRKNFVCAKMLFFYWGLNTGQILPTVVKGKAATRGSQVCPCLTPQPLPHKYTCLERQERSGLPAIRTTFQNMHCLSTFTLGRNHQTNYVCLCPQLLNYKLTLQDLNENDSTKTCQQT